MCAERQVRRQRITARGHDRKSPRGNLNGPTPFMNDSMFNRYLGTCLCQSDDHLASNLGRLLDQVRNPDGQLILDRVLHLGVVEGIAKAVVPHRNLPGRSRAGVPPPIFHASSLDLPASSATSLKTLRSSSRTIGDNTRPNPDGNDNFGKTVGELEVLFPASKG